MTKKSDDKTTSDKLASLASEVLRDKTASPQLKSFAGSALAQAKSGPSKSKKGR